MYRTQILLEAERHKTLAEIARREERSLSDVVREMLDQQIAERKKRELANAAQDVTGRLPGRPELTVFQILDGEDIHA